MDDDLGLAAGVDVVTGDAVHLVVSDEFERAGRPVRVHEELRVHLIPGTMYMRNCVFTFFMESPQCLRIREFS